ncbi:NAD(P)/FAD-dependent oxidoreductase [Aquirufa rosea]|uniref:FAD-binding protein n=1 Tax=Aquirufa rosea TaxID=2509241 RepID=A0A4Q1C2A5_9BACT|nr:NAD(P)/FAD-dependent oxidoreductase [Aquirufa rosea]RXK52269.1 FAD-binding protein [Aquirufa rosea]
MLDLKDFVVSPEIAHSPALLHEYLISELGTNLLNSYQYRIEKKSIDARNRQINVNLRIGFYEKNHDFSLSQFAQLKPLPTNSTPVIIVGSGPAGLFAALRLIQLGIKPIVLERGKNVRDRRRDLAAINRFNLVDSDSNYCFGEGGAGTYSDGKLYTRSTKRGDIKSVLETFVAHGADKNILFEAHPHIGTNKLPAIIASIRTAIIEAGGEVHFNQRVTDFILENHQIKGVITAQNEEFRSDKLLLATGHSARDIFELLRHKNILIESKGFAIGVRIEHRQSLIDACQYKMKERPKYLPPASFSLVSQTRYKGLQRGVFSFCMCPGGFIVPSATSQNQVVVNGMSPSRRDSQYANSGIVVGLLDNDWAKFKSEGALAGMYLQESLEQKAHQLAGGTQKAISQLTQDFIQKKTSKSYHDSSYVPGLIPGEMRDFLPDFIAEPLAMGLQDFQKKIPHFSSNVGQIIGLESRTSSPVKIPRNPETLEHPQIKGLFPCGEGAGYAGGIMSAALDGIRCAEAIAS